MTANSKITDKQYALLVKLGVDKERLNITSAEASVLIGQKLSGKKDNTSQQVVTQKAGKATPVASPHDVAELYFREKDQRRRDIFASVALKEANIFWAGKESARPQDIDATATHFFELLLEMSK